MKKLLTLLLSFTIVTVGLAQGNGKGKGKGNKKDKSYKHTNKNDRYDDDNNTGVFGRRIDTDNQNRGQGKYAKNQPSKVRSAFYRDYPNATNVNWTKNQGSWTATFNNGGIFNTRTTATYHSNGQRRDAYNNTAQNGQQQGTVLDRILQRRPVN